jgi:hypothetical protein
MFTVLTKYASWKEYCQTFSRKDFFWVCVSVLHMLHAHPSKPSVYHPSNIKLFTGHLFFPVCLSKSIHMEYESVIKWMCEEMLKWYRMNARFW